MTNLEIDRALALAIGWKPEQMRTNDFYLLVAFQHPVTGIEYPWWRTFSHTDPAVIWPIAERFDCFPFKTLNGNWCSFGDSGATDSLAKVHNNPATAVALAVIEAHK